MFLLFVEDDVFAEINNLAVNSRTHIAGPSHVEQFFAVFALPSSHDRSQHLEFGSLWERPDSVYHLLDGLGRDLFAAVEAERPADSGKEQAEIIVNLRDGPDGGPRVMAGALLLDGNRRGEPFDRIHVRLAHLLQELPGIGGEGLDVPALPFGVDRVEGEGRFAGPAQTCDDHEPVPRNLNVQILEVMLPRPADDDRAAHKRRDYTMPLL